MAAQNEPNFALLLCLCNFDVLPTSSDLDFLTDELFTEMDFLTEQTETSETVNVEKRHFNGFACVAMSFARVLCNRYDARWISKTKSQNGKMEEWWNNISLIRWFNI